MPAGVPPTTSTPVQVRLSLNTYHLQALVQAPTLAQVHHIDLAVYRNGTAVPGATRSVSAAALSTPFTLTGLRLGTTYEIRATAYADVAGTLPLSDASLSRATFTTPSVTLSNGVASVDTAPLAVSVPVKLADRVYSGQVPVTVAVLRSGVKRVRLTLYRDAAIVVQSSMYDVATIPATLTMTLKNLKPGVGTYRLQADGMNSAGNGNGGSPSTTATASLSTLPVAGILNDLLPAIALTLN